MPAARERSELSEAIAAQIRAERSAARLTVEQTAKQAGIPYATYRKLEDGRGTVDAEQLSRLCRKVYGITLREYFSRVEQRLAAREDYGTSPPNG